MPSMWPPPFSDGNDRAGRVPGDSDPPSMWPPPFSDGNLQEKYLIEYDGFPSMWPPPFSDGNTIAPSLGLSGANSFNVATAFQRWKLPGPGDEPRCPSPFNVATAFQRWKHAGEALLAESGDILQCGHRLSAMETGRRASRRRSGCQPFNVATAFQRWKREGHCVGADSLPALQCGHRLSAMET